jgi:ATP:ADP antiporter, AAA family
VSAREPNGEGDRDLLGRFLMVRREERGAVVLAALYFFLVLLSYFVLQPIRDQLGLAGGSGRLKELWTFTMVGSALASALFSSVSARYPRRTFLPVTYRFCALNILAFGGLLASVDGPVRLWVGYVFYVWLAVYGYFGVSVFWGFMADSFGVEQSRRLFGLFAVGGTLGALAGNQVTARLVSRIDLPWLFVIAAVALELAVWCIRPLARRPVQRGAQLHASEPEALGGGSVEGWKLIARSSYLSNIALFTFLFAVVQTFATFQQYNILEREIADDTRRTQYFAEVGTAQQALTLIVQLFVTGRLMKLVGTTGALVALPLLALAGFLALAAAHAGAIPALATVTVFLVLLKGLNHATMRPAREALFVPTTRREKYQAKAVNDTFVSRGGDQIAAWSFDGIKFVLGGSLRGVAIAAIPLSIAWAVVAFWLGIRHRRLTEASDEAAPPDQDAGADPVRG